MSGGLGLDGSPLPPWSPEDLILRVDPVLLDEIERPEDPGPEADQDAIRAVIEAMTAGLANWSSINVVAALEGRAAYVRLQEAERDPEQYAKATSGRIKARRRANGHATAADGGEAPAEAPDVAALARHECSDTGNAARLLARHGRDLLFAAHDGWFTWDGQRFVRDELQATVLVAQQTAKAIFEECPHLTDLEAQKTRAKWAVCSQNQTRVNGMLAMAAPHLALMPDQLDADPWLLNVANGTIDLRTGELHPHRRADRLSKLAPVIYDPHAQAPLWQRFVNEIMAGDEDLVSFLRRSIGYTLTGDVSEQVIFVEHGGGSNGKSTKLEVLAALLGDYGQMTPTETFLAKDRSSGVPNDVARLRGARFVSAVETGSGRRLDEGLVKQATGGDRMTARFLNKEFFEFAPSFKLWLATNHKPEVRGTDHAIWRRIRLIPFGVRFWRPDELGRPEDALVVDKRLRAKLLAELPGILAWAVRGCLEWQKDGLKEPSKVLAATAAYRAEMDCLGDFLADQCDVDPYVSGKASDLYAAYKSWCQRNGEEPRTQTWFGREMGERGFTKEKAGTVVYRGLRLRAAEREL